jgi:hypothetical protein
VPDCGVREEARHSRAGLLIMPSLRDSSVSDFRPPALPCRAIDYAVPKGLSRWLSVSNFYFCDRDSSAQRTFWSIQIYLSMYQLHFRIRSKGLSPGEGVAVAWTVAQIDIQGISLATEFLIPGFPAIRTRRCLRSRKQIVRKPWKVRTFRVFRIITCCFPKGSAT